MVLSRLAPLLPLLVLAASGCISNANGIAAGDDSGLPLSEDGGTLPTEDATVPFDASIPDATVTETSVPVVDSGDAAVATEDAGPAPVTILVTNDVGPEPGVLILFHDATGAVTGTATTGATGTATQTLAANGQVTAVFMNAGPTQMGLVTIQGVQPGDALTVFDDVNLAFPSGYVQLTSVPDASSLEATDIVAVTGSNTTSVDSLPLTLNAGYTNYSYPAEIAGKSAVLLTLSNGAGTEVGYAYQKNEALLVDGGAQLSVPGPWLTTEKTETFDVTVYTDDSGTVQEPELNYGEIAGGVLSSGGSVGGGQTGNVISTTFTGHPGFADAVQTEGLVSNYFNGYRLLQSIAAHVDASAPTPSVDLSQVLPQITSSSTTMTDAGTPVFTWTTSGPLSAIDGFIVQTYYDVVPVDGGTSPIPYWRIVAPPSSTSVTPPTLPASFGTYTLQSGSETIPVVIGVEASYLAGYAQMRQAFATLTPSPPIVFNTGGAISPVMPVDGTLKLTSVTYQGD